MTLIFCIFVAMNPMIIDHRRLKVKVICMLHEYLLWLPVSIDWFL